MALNLSAESERRGEKEIQELYVTLSASFSWANENGVIKYQDLFLRLLLDVQEEDKGRIKRQIETLAKSGMEYTSLHTRKNEAKIPFSPKPCFSSRGTDEWRFTWTKEVGVITLHWLYRKGDSRIGQSES